MLSMEIGKPRPQMVVKVGKGDIRHKDINVYDRMLYQVGIT